VAKVLAVFKMNDIAEEYTANVFLMDFNFRSPSAINALTLDLYSK
jgi:hypothetical protein